MEFMSKNEKAVSAFIEGKTMDEVKQAIRDLAESAWNASFLHIQNALSVDSGDFASCLLSGEKFNFSKETQIAWLEYYASREIVDFIEEYKEIENALEIREAIGGAFPRPTE